MPIFRDEPPVTEEDTQPFQGYPKPQINTRGLAMEYLWHPNEKRAIAVFKGAASVALRQRGWKRISQKEYEARTCQR